MMRLRSAILLDFDNVWHSLEKEDERAACRFANFPSVWVDAIANGELLPFTEPEAVERAILFLRCYANPNLMQRAKCRASFTRAGFSVIDCPPLTSHGKNSADIHMVLDAVELLEHATRFDEFIVLSADADFTPLLTKLRTHDRRTAVFANQETSAAYRAVASGMLQLGDMLEFLANAGGGREVDRSTIEAALADRMIEAVRAAVQKAAAPVPLATAAQLAADAVGGDSRRWAGYGQFSRLLTARLDTRLRCADDHVFDPKRHRTPGPAKIAAQANASPRIGDLPADLRDFALRLRGLTDCPILTAAQFRMLFALLAEKLAVAPFDLNATSREVRDNLVARKLPIGRATIWFVMKGVQLSGRELGASPPAEALADAYRASLAALCDQAGSELSKEDLFRLGEWLGC